MRSTSTLLLLVLVGGLLIYIFGFEHEAPGTKEKQERQVRPFSFKTDQADKIEITTADEEILLEREASGRWKMTKPVQDHANPDKIKSLLDAVSTLEWLQTFQREDLARGDLENTGLDEPRAIITIKSKDQSLASLRLGSQSAIEGAIYASLQSSGNGKDNADAIHLTRSPLRDLIPITTASWRDQKLIRLKADNILSLAIDNGTNTMDFERDPATRAWNLIKPLRTRASTERVNAILNAILNLESIPPQPDTPKPGDTTIPPLTVKLTSSDSSAPIIITLQANTDMNLPVRAEVKDRPDFYQTTPKAHDLWRLQPNHMRDQQLARFDVATVNALRLNSTAQGEVSMQKDGGEWMLKRFGKTEPANHERITQLLERLNIEQVREFISDTATNPEPYGLNLPFLEVTWEIGSTTTTLQFGAGPENKVYARYKDDPFIYRVSPAIFSVMPPDITKWRSLKVINASLFATRRLIISKGDSPALTLNYNPDQGSWDGAIAGNDITPKINIPAANLYLQQLISFEAADWTSDRREAYIALKAPSLTLQLLLVESGQTENQGQTQTLSFAPLQPGKDTAIYHGRLDGDPDTFLITRETYRQLLTNLIKE